MTPALILASTSRYRKELLTRLGVAFSCDKPETDESAHEGETPRALALRLAAEKARAVAEALGLRRDATGWRRSNAE